VTERGTNRAVVALANKNARIVWALLSRGDQYRAAASENEWPGRLNESVSPAT